MKKRNWRLELEGLRRFLAGTATALGLILGILLCHTCNAQAPACGSYYYPYQRTCPVADIRPSTTPTDCISEVGADVLITPTTTTIQTEGKTIVFCCDQATLTEIWIPRTHGDFSSPTGVYYEVRLIYQPRIHDTVLGRSRTFIRYVEAAGPILPSEVVRPRPARG